MTLNIVGKIGEKGQIVLKKELRDKLGMNAGRLVEERLTKKGILIIPLESKEVLEDIEKTVKKVMEKWPKNLDSVQAVKKERR